MRSRGTDAAPLAAFAALFFAFALAAFAIPPRAHAHGAHACTPARQISPFLAAPDPAADALEPTPSVLAPSRIYIANDDHTDYMWSATETPYRNAFLNMLDYYMAQAETTAWRPADFRGKFSTDGSMWLWIYERERSASQFQRLIGHVRGGSITVPLNTCVQLYGAMPAEAVIRSFSYAGRLERRENLRFPLVVPMENQTLPGGVASLFAGCGAKYSWKGICGCATRIDAANRPRDVYRFRGPDGQSLLMKWHRMYQGSMSLGGYAEARTPSNVVDFIGSNSTFLSRWPYSVAGAFGYGWDDLQSTTHQFIDTAIQKSNGSRRVIVSNEVDFFQDFEASHGAAIPTYGACYGNEWDLYTASIGEVTAKMKRAVEGLRTAEALAALASKFDPGLWGSMATARDSAMLACGLYYEHSFGPGPGVSESQRNAWERRLQSAMTAYTVRLRDASAAAVGKRVAQMPGAERHVVFNPLSWARTDAVDLTVTTPEPRHVVDVATGAQLPSQTVVVDGQTRLRVLVSAVPAVGYRTIDVRSGEGSAFPPAATVTLPAMDNGIVKVTLGTRGQITSLVDHTDANRELVAAGYALNDIGTSAGTGTVTVESQGPVSVTLKVTATALTRDTRITLYAGSRRVEVKNEIRQNFANDVGYSSRFALPGMIMRHEEVGMIARVGRLSQGGDYANENTRTDGLTLNHFVDLSDASRGVTLSAWDASFFKAGNSDPWTLDATTPAVRTVVGNQPDGAGLGQGITGQGGDTYFLHRLAFGTHGAYDPAAAMRFALEHQNPLLDIPAKGKHRGLLPATLYSMLSIDSPEVLLWSLKPAEEGPAEGLIARVWNVADAPRTATLALPPSGIASAQVTTHIETNLAAAPLANGRLPLSLARQQIATFRLMPGTGSEPIEPSSAEQVRQEAAGTAVQLVAYPNPVRSGNTAMLSFSLAREGMVRLTLHDVGGARVATLIDGPQGAGRHEVSWHSGAGGGHAVRPGLYFARLETPEGTFGTRIVLME